MHDRVKGYSSNEVSQKQIQSYAETEEIEEDNQTKEFVEKKKEGVGAAARRRAAF